MDIKFDVSKWLTDINIYKLMVANGFRIQEHVSGKERMDLLRAALLSNNVSFVQEMIANGLALTQERYAYSRVEEQSPLILCLKTDGEVDIHMVRLLVQAGCSVNEISGQVRNNVMNYVLNTDPVMTSDVRFIC